MPSSPLSSTLIMGPETPELEDFDWGNDKLPDDSELVWDLMLQLNAHKFMTPTGIHPRVLKELADVIWRPLNYFSMVLGIWRSPSRLEAAKRYPNSQEG